MLDAVKIIGKMIDQCRTSFVSSVDSDGFPNTRALLKPRKREGIKYIYFSTNTSSKKITQFKENPKACIYILNRLFFRGIMLKGTMEVLEDAASKEMIWKRGDKMYYPLGVTDPDYCVLRFTAEQGSYYSNLYSEEFDIE